MRRTVSVDNQHTEARRGIFRPAAVRRYTQQQASIALPQLVALRTIVAVWIALGFLTGASAGIWTAHVPIVMSGNAVIVNQGSAAQHTPVLVAFLPAAAHSQLAPGQALLVRLDAGGAYSRQTIMSVEPEIISPDAAQRRFGTGLLPLITRPAAVAIAPLAPSRR